MPECDWNHTSHGYFPVNLLHIFRTPFLKNTSRRLLLYVFFEKRYKLLGIKYSPLHLPICLTFLKFCCTVSGKKYFYVIIVWFSSFQCALPFFTGLFLSIFYKQLSSSFQLSSSSSWLPLTNFRQFVKKMIIFLQHFDVFMISSQPFTTVQPGHWKLSQIRPTIQTIIPHHVIWDSIEVF